MKNLFGQWLTQNNRPARYVNTIKTISNDLKRVNYIDFDLFLINNPVIAKKIKDDYFNFNEYYSKNDRGNYMYSSAFDRYIEFLEDSKIIFNSEELIIYPDEIKEEKLIEGAKKQVTVNTYERDPNARQQCIEKYGYKCSVCKFDFEKNYGEVGQNFIHVHHLKPLSEIKEQYEINPIEDLRPVCPNCHAMLHKKNPAYSIEEIQDFINKNTYNKYSYNKLYSK